MAIDMTDNRMVTVPLWALEFVMKHAEFCDNGPIENGWPSDEMSKAKTVLDAAVNEATSFKEVGK